MAIYLDSNVMYDWRTFAEADRVALAVLARELDQPVIVPSLVAEELEASLRRRLQRAADEFEALTDKLTDLFKLDYVHSEPSLALELVIDPWRAGVGEEFGSCEVSAEDALAGLRREIAGQLPARRTSPTKPGIGGRDAAIWLAIVRDHIAREDNGFFITRDARGFAPGDGLHEELQADLAGCARPLSVFSSVEEFVQSLGKRDDTEVDVAVIGPQVIEVAREGLRDLRALPRAVFDQDHDVLEFKTEVKDGEVLRVVRAQRFDGQFGEILLVDAECRLAFRLGYRRPPPDPDDRTWFAVDDLEARGRVQVYLASDNAGRFIAAQLRPRQQVSLSGGGLTIMSTLGDD